MFASTTVRVDLFFVYRHSFALKSQPINGLSSVLEYRVYYRIIGIGKLETNFLANLCPANSQKVTI